MTFPDEHEAEMDRAEIEAQRREMEAEQEAEAAAEDAGADTVAGCVDCILFLANGDEPEDREGLAEDIAEMWPDYHLVPAGGEDSEPWFSWSPCEVCGSRLGGNREAVAFWKCEAMAPA